MARITSKRIIIIIMTQYLNWPNMLGNYAVYILEIKLQKMTSHTYPGMFTSLRLKWVNIHLLEDA